MDLLGQTALSFLVFGFIPGALLAAFCTRPHQREMVLFGLGCGAVGLAGAYSMTGYAGSMQMASLQGPITQIAGSLVGAVGLLMIFGRLRAR